MNLDDALAFSHYARRVVDADPALRDALLATLDAPFDWARARTAIDAATAAPDATGTLGAALRALRTRVMVHTLARDLTGRAGLAEVCGAVTTLAEVAIDAAVAATRRELVATHGEPLGSEGGAPQPFVVVGMGKLGGGELNVSSDIDLVFLYPEEGETAGPRVVANREFFDRLGRRVIAMLDDATADGFVFRVDMRLRPYGESGPLTMSYAALENYLVTQGRAWERYAWLKARALTGVPQDEVDAIVGPFVYRKYLDYDAYAGLRDVHRQIREQAARRDARDNVKLGPGGIREIEFIVQALQIVRGGREPGLRIRNTRAALAALASRGHLPESAAAALDAAYVFLRDTEHRLQYRDDQQTQALPDDPGELDALASALRFPSTPDFRAALDEHRLEAGRQFESVFGAADAGADAGTDAEWRSVWDAPDVTDEHVAQLERAGFDDPPALLGTLARARAGTRYSALPAQSKERFDKLVPRMLAAATASPGGSGAQATFMRLLSLLEAVARRSAYLALVIEHPPLIPRLAGLMGASAWAADYLTRHPILLDELLDARVLMEEPDHDAWRAELGRMLAEHAGDQEREMDALRHFQHAQSFRLLAQDLAGQLTVERLADHLSALADVVLEATLGACWRHLAGADAPPPRFAIIGYGKLGGKELGYASDLDIVFVYDVDPDDPDGDAKLARYSRLAQRMNTWLASNTPAGQLYDTDLRLRPDGAKGLIASSLGAFKRYQREQAWTWEHQALTRARWIAGDAAIGAAFEAEREAILRLPRDRAKLADEVVAMRRRMHDGHPNPTALFDLKHDPGGMVDIEFVVQYLVLAHAHDQPRLTGNLGNIALLRVAGELGLVPADLAARVADAYREFRKVQHAIRLTGAPHVRVDPAAHAQRRADVDAVWRTVFGSPWSA
ncbi:MAG: bifunctional [glutamate--ammonia ligase]-adenylyl-L-tyrosine phosphorylase/[glutamate--ammonia-ligase] adenylyltransferase [Betaproteobacteria bacterium]|nr:bifunctional [glutamate--ammonia ligase]-adenylyl-L-tyrosine phosphorylase/[glutamate--ammonia-ligase] adenylyltransferase [Betaproteobacteria bacterium]